MDFCINVCFRLGYNIPKRRYLGAGCKCVENQRVCFFEQESCLVTQILFCQFKTSIKRQYFSSLNDTDERCFRGAPEQCGYSNCF